MPGQWAAPNYEPTADEMIQFLADWRETTGRSGFGYLRVVRAVEHLIWEIEGVYWGKRELLDDGTVRYEWVRP